VSRFDRFMVHVDIGRDEKLARLTDAERICHVAGVLALAAKSPIRGRLLVGDLEASPREVGRMAAVSDRVAKSTIDKLLAVGVLVHDEEYGCLRVHNWERFNPEPKDDPSNAERQARWRDRNAARNGRSNAAVTLPREGASPIAGARSPEGKEEEGEEQQESAGATREYPATATDPLSTVSDERLTETVTILRQCQRLQFDLELIGVANTLAAFKDADHITAARFAVTNASDPNYRTTDAGKALRYAFNELERQQRPRSGGPRPKPEPARKPWDGALRQALDAKDAA
jgi:hypothetical protein